MLTTRPNNKPSRNISGSQQLGLTVPPRRLPRSKKQKKQRKRGRKTGNMLQRGTRLIGPIKRQVCGVLDPFCPHAVGMKTWGAQGVQTIAYTIHAIHNLNTDTAQATSFFFYPDFVNGYASAVAVAGTTTLPALGAWSVPSALPAIEGRVVTAGFIVRNITKAMDVLGTYYVVPMTRYTVGDTFAGAPLLIDSRTTIVAASKGGETAVVSFRKGYGALDFHTSLDGTGNQPDFQPWMVYFPATTTVNNYQIEYFVHIEFVPNIAGQYFLAAGSNTGRQAVNEQVGALAGTVSAHAAQVVSRAAGSAADAFGKGIARLATRAAGMAVGAYFGGPQGAFVGGNAAGLLTDAVEVD